MDMSKVIVLVFQKSRNLLADLSFAQHCTSLVCRGLAAELLNYSGRLVERPSCNEALLACDSLNIEYQAVSRELLPLLDPDDEAWLDFTPGDWQESFDFPGDHEVINIAVVDPLVHLALSKLNCQVPGDGKAHVEHEGDDGDQWGLLA